MKIRNVALIVLAAVTTLYGDDLRSDWNVRDHVPLNKVIVQSHRGAGELMPENSLEAFEYAWSHGTVPEADVRTTSDGVIVAFHDNDFRRVLPDASQEMQKKGIKDLTWAEAARLDIGSFRGAQFAGQRVPRMADVYRAMKKNRERRMYMDIKNVDLEQFAREGRQAGVLSQFIVASTDYALLRRWKSIAPESSTLLWMGGTEEVLTRRLAEARDARFESITQLQIHVRTPDGKLTPSPEFLLRAGVELRKHGILFQVFPWNSKDPALFQRLMDLGVASFATDYPEVTMQAIRDYYAARR